MVQQDKRRALVPPIRLAELASSMYMFEFNDDFYRQIIEVAIGTKICLPLYVLFRSPDDKCPKQQIPVYLAGIFRYRVPD